MNEWISEQSNLFINGNNNIVRTLLCCYTISQIGTSKCLERFHACIRISPECTQYGVYGNASYGKIRQFSTLAILPMCSSVLVTVLVLGPSPSYGKIRQFSTLAVLPMCSSVLVYNVLQQVDANLSCRGGDTMMVKQLVTAGRNRLWNIFWSALSSQIHVL